MDTKYLLHLTAEVYFHMHKHRNYKLNIQEIFTKKLKVVKREHVLRCPDLSILTSMLLDNAQCLTWRQYLYALSSNYGQL